jgi:hypothetical protein
MNMHIDQSDLNVLATLLSHRIHAHRLEVALNGAGKSTGH